MNEILIKDKTILESFIKGKNMKASEVNYSNLFIWRHKYLFSYLINNEFLWIVNQSKSGLYFSQPIGDYSNEEKLFASINHVKSVFSKTKLILKKCDQDILDILLKSDLDIVFNEVRDDFDYIYDFEALKAMKGNLYHKKKNHINHFIKNYDWHFDKISKLNISDVFKVVEKWFVNVEDDLLEEKRAIYEALNHYDDLSIIGGILYIGSLPVAFTLGEVLNDDTLLIHIEKAIPELKGAYPMLMHQFLQIFDGLKFVNREQDLGIPGLRKSKLSYHPIGFIKKYRVEL